MEPRYIVSPEDVAEGALERLEGAAPVAVGMLRRGLSVIVPARLAAVLMGADPAVRIGEPEPDWYVAAHRRFLYTRS